MRNIWIEVFLITYALFAQTQNSFSTLAKSYTYLEMYRKDVLLLKVLLRLSRNGNHSSRLVIKESFSIPRRRSSSMPSTIHFGIIKRHNFIQLSTELAKQISKILNNIPWFRNKDVEFPIEASVNKFIVINDRKYPRKKASIDSIYLSFNPIIYQHLGFVF